MLDKTFFFDARFSEILICQMGQGGVKMSLHCMYEIPRFLHLMGST